MDKEQSADVLAELQALRQRVSELESQIAVDSPDEERSTRRGMLRLAGAAVVGGAASLISAESVAAADVLLGSANNAGAAATSITSSSLLPTLGATNTAQGSGLAGTSSGLGVGVSGTVTTPGSGAAAVYGVMDGVYGYALVGSGGAAQLRLIPAVGAGFSPDFHRAGNVFANADGVFACVIDGAPGTWRKLAGPATAGAFHAILPSRVYDSRAAAPSPGLLAAGVSRTISLADKRDVNGAVTVSNLVPAGATAVTANITVTGTTGTFGYLSINPGGVTSADSSTINWFGAGQNIANGVTLTLNATRELTVVCGPGGGSTHFIVDVSGYYI